MNMQKYDVKFLNYLESVVHNNVECDEDGGHLTDRYCLLTDLVRDLKRERFNQYIKKIGAVDIFEL